MKVALFLGALMTASAKLKLIGPNGSFIARLIAIRDLDIDNVLTRNYGFFPTFYLGYKYLM